MKRKRLNLRPLSVFSTKNLRYMNTNKGLITLVGFVLAGLGFLALVLSLVGVQFSFLTWIDAPGRLFGFLMRLIMIIIGIIMVYLAQTDFEGKDQ